MGKFDLNFFWGYVSVFLLMGCLFTLFFMGSFLRRSVTCGLHQIFHMVVVRYNHTDRLK